MATEPWRKDFHCKQCGRCCQNLSGAYAFSPCEKDIRMWKKAGRFDILAWIEFMDIIDPRTKKEVFCLPDAWISPKTGESVFRCPWLRKLPNQGKFICRIHDLKPEHCKRFPNFLKYAKEIHCKGLFENAI